MARTERKHPRVDSDLKVSVRLARGGQVESGRIRNISLGGLFIEMEPLPFGAELQLSFSLPGAPRTLTCKAYVVWSTRREPERAAGLSGNGLRLADLSVADMRLLAEYVQARL